MPVAGSLTYDTKLNTKEFEKGLEQVKSLGNTAFKGMSVAMGTVGASMGVVAKKALDIGTEYQKASNQIQASTGATAEEMKELNKAMTNTYANNFGESLEDVAGVIAELKKQMGVQFPAEGFQELAQYAITLRDTFEYDVSESIRSANTLMTQFGIDGNEAFNLIAQGSQNGLDYSGELLDNINEYSVQFAKLGFSAEDMFNIFESGAESGAFNLDKIGDAVKEFSIRAIDGSNTTIDGFTRLGLNADEMAAKFASGGDVAKEAFYEVIQRIAEMDDEVEQSIVGVDLFGTMWEDLGPEVVTQLGNMQGKFDGAKNTLEEMSKIKYDDLGSAFEGIGRQIETGILLPISQDLLPIFNDLANKLSDALESGELDGSIQQISDGITTLATAFGDLASKVLPLVIDAFSWFVSNGSTIVSVLAGIAVGMKVFQIGSSIATFVTGIKGAITAVNGFSGAFKALTTAMNANPFVLIATIIATVITVLITLWNTNEDFRNAVINIWEGIKNAFKTAIDAIVGFFTNIIDFVKNNWKGLLLLIANPFAGAFKLLYDNCEGFRNFIDDFVESIKEFFINGWNSIVEFFTETIPAFIQSVIEWFMNLPYNIGYAIGTIIGYFLNLGVSLWNWVTTELPQIIQSVINWFASLPGRIWEFLTNIITDIGNWGLNVLTTLNDWVGQAINAVINWFKSLPGKIWSWLQNAINKVKEFGTNIVNKAKTSASNLVTKFVDTIKGLPNKLKNLGQSIVEGLWNGIKNAGNWLWNKVREFAQGVIDAIKDQLGIHSPSRVMAYWGKYIPQGLAVGIEADTDSAIKAIENMNNEIEKKMKSAVYSETAKVNASASVKSNNIISNVGTFNIQLNGEVDIDGKRAGKILAPEITKTFRTGGVTA